MTELNLESSQLRITLKQNLPNTALQNTAGHGKGPLREVVFLALLPFGASRNHSQSYPSSLYGDLATPQWFG